MSFAHYERRTALHEQESESYDTLFPIPKFGKSRLPSCGNKIIHFSRYINATASRISRFFLPSRPRAHKSVVYLEGSFDLFHVGYVDILEELVACEMRRKNLEMSADVFVILGLRHVLSAPASRRPACDRLGDSRLSAPGMGEDSGPPCLQSLNERAISILSLKLVDDVVFDVQNRVDETFRRSLGISSVYVGTVTG